MSDVSAFLSSWLLVQCFPSVVGALITGSIVSRTIVAPGKAHGVSRCGTRETGVEAESGADGDIC